MQIWAETLFFFSWAVILLRYSSCPLLLLHICVDTTYPLITTYLCVPVLTKKEEWPPFSLISITHHVLELPEDNTKFEGTKGEQLMRKQIADELWATPCRGLASPESCSGWWSNRKLCYGKNGVLPSSPLPLMLGDYNTAARWHWWPSLGEKKGCSRGWPLQRGGKVQTKYLWWGPSAARGREHCI